VVPAAALYHGLIKASAVNDVRGFVSLIDERVRRLLSMFGLVVHPIPGTTTAAYGGSQATTPVWADAAAFVGDQRRNNPEAYRLITLGVGLDGVRVPGPEAFRLRRPAATRSPFSRIDLTDALVGSGHREVLQA
jgi:hypothetical protein